MRVNNPIPWRAVSRVTAWWQSFSRARRLIVLALAVSTLAGVGVAAALWSDHEPRVASYARQYLDQSVCLLTGATGVNGASAAQVWAGMQRASLASRVRVQYVSVPGRQTPAASIAVLNGLASARCTALFAVDSGPVVAAKNRAKAFPGVRFFVVDAKEVAGVTAIDPHPAGLAGRVEKAMLGVVAE